MKKFVVGQKYSYCSWITGGQIFYEVDSIKSDKVKLKTTDYELDGTHNRFEEYEIQRNEDGDEFIVLFTYKGEDCVIEANEMPRSKKEMVELFFQYAYRFNMDAKQLEKDGMINEAWFQKGKAEAYENAAFEIWNNLGGVE